MMFCRYCRHQTKMIVGDPTYRIAKMVESIRPVSCTECTKFLHNAVRKYEKNTPVNLITGVITQPQLNRLISERARARRIINSTFLKPQLRRYKIATTSIKNSSLETTINSEFETVEDTPTNRRYARFRVFESMYNTDKKGKRHPKTKPIEMPVRERVWCNEMSRFDTQGGELGKLYKHGMEKITDKAFGMGTKIKARICIEGHWQKMGYIVKNGNEVLTNKWVEDWRDYIPTGIETTDTTKNANLDEVKYCGFGLCPNRYGYITRPDKLSEVFAH